MPRRRRRKPTWSRVLSLLDAKQIVTLLLSFSGVAGAFTFQRGDTEKRVDGARQQTRAVSDNAAQIISVLALAVDSLDVRVGDLERENARLRRRRPDTIFVYDAASYGPQPRPRGPGFVNRLSLGLFGS